MIRFRVLRITRGPVVDWQLGHEIDIALGLMKSPATCYEFGAPSPGFGQARYSSANASRSPSVYNASRGD